MPNPTIVEALRQALREEMKRDETVILMGEDIGTTPGGWGGPHTVTQGLVEEFGNGRVRNTPIAETGFFGAAVGAAMMGFHPVIEVQHADFVFVAMDMIVNQAAKLNYLSGGEVQVPLVLRMPVGARGLGGLHSQCPEAYFTHTPGLKVVTPCTAYDAKGLLKSAIRDGGPVIFSEHKLLYGTRGIRFTTGEQPPLQEIPDEEYSIPIGKAEIKRTGKHVTILSNLLMLHKSLEAASHLEKEGIQCEVIDARTLAPFDMETLAHSLEKTSRLVIVEEDNLTNGWGAEVAARVADECLFLMEAPVKRVTAYDVTVPFSLPLENYVIPSVERIIGAVKFVLEK